MLLSNTKRPERPRRLSGYVEILISNTEMIQHAVRRAVTSVRQANKAISSALIKLNQYRRINVKHAGRQELTHTAAPWQSSNGATAVLVVKEEEVVVVASLYLSQNFFFFLKA